MSEHDRVVIIGGVGTRSDFGQALIDGLSGAGGYGVVAVARSAGTVEALRDRVAASDRVLLRAGDLLDPDFAVALVEEVERDLGPVAGYVHNAGRLLRGSFLELGPGDFEQAWRVNVGTALPITRAVLGPMLERGEGALIYTGATASVRGGAAFGPFASSKFALRGLAQSLARELGPRGIHVAHVVVDGVIWGQRAASDFGMARQDCIEPRDLAQTYLQLLQQPPSCWTHELDLRPAAERF
jgi:NAD(P)-dependent dehydrogenase (short-subunit alcohol dehydrogenase family)